MVCLFGGPFAGAPRNLGGLLCLHLHLLNVMIFRYLAGGPKKEDADEENEPEPPEPFEYIE